MASSWPTSLPLLHESAVDFADIVRRASGGRLTIVVEDPSKHSQPAGILDLVKSGQYDLGHTTAQYYARAIPAIDYFTAVPFGLTAIENHAWMEQGGGQELFEKLMAPHGILPLSAGNTAVQMGGWFDREIRTAEDFKGVVIRISGVPARVLERLGAKTLGLPLGRIVDAFEKKEINAADVVGPAIDITLPLARYAPYYYAPWHEPDVVLHAFVNKAKFDALPEDLREIVRTSARAASLRSIARAHQQNALAMGRLIAGGTQLRSFPPDVLTALKEATRGVLAEAAAADPDSRAVIESFRAVRGTAAIYAPYADGAVIAGRGP